VLALSVGAVGAGGVAPFACQPPLELL